jgi:hypothetical protein
MSTDFWVVRPCTRSSQKGVSTIFTDRTLKLFSCSSYVTNITFQNSTDYLFIIIPSRGTRLAAETEPYRLTEEQTP